MVEFAEKIRKFPAYYLISSTRALLKYSPNARVLRRFFNYSLENNLWYSYSLYTLFVYANANETKKVSFC